MAGEWRLLRGGAAQGKGTDSDCWEGWLGAHCAGVAATWQVKGACCGGGGALNAGGAAHGKGTDSGCWDGWLGRTA